MPKTVWRGVFPASTTQFNDDESLNVTATLDHVEMMIRAGVHGMIMLGTVGENNSLDAAEKRAVLAATVDRIDKRVPVLTGVAETTTKKACQFAEDAQKAGVDGLMLLPGMVYKSDPKETMT